MNTIELDENYVAASARLKELEEERQVILASIEDKIQANREARKEESAKRTEAANKLFPQVTYENLLDPLAWICFGIVWIIR